MVIGFISAVVEYFGVKKNSNSRTLLDEINKLSKKEKEEMSIMLSKELNKEVSVTDFI